MANYSGLEYMATGGNTPPLVQTMDTGGNLPPTLVQPAAPIMTTGGNTPPLVAPTMNTGGNLPPELAQIVNTGGNLPPQLIPPVMNTGGNLPPTVVQPGAQFSAVNTTLGSLDQILNSENPYIQNATRRGLELAGRRGLSNSSIAAGAAQRGALEGAMPILGQAMSLHGDREGRALQSTMQERQLSQARDLQYNDAALQDWMNSNQFNRQFNANLAMMPINNTYQFMQTIAQYGLENPEIYTPDVISGTSNFFTRNMFDILSQYFPGSVSGGTP